MRPVFLFFSCLALASGATAQTITCTSGLETSANVVFDTDTSINLDGAGLAAGDRITAHTPDGRCVGELTWANSGGAQNMVIWGGVDDPLNPTVQGYSDGDPLAFRVYKPGQTIFQTTATYDLGETLCSDVQYHANCLYSLASFTSEGSRVLDATIFLSGAYASATGTMTTALNAAGALPLTQPYLDDLFESTPLDYELELSVPANFFDDRPSIVDYVLVELRTGTAASTRVGRRLALLHSNGTVVDFDGSSPVSLAGFAANNYYVVLRHRNHLPVMSAGPVDFSSGTGTWNFTTAASQAYGSGQNDLGDGAFGLVSGDASANGQVQASDKNLYFLDEVGQAGYLPSDFNLNGQVQASDKNLHFLTSVGRGSAVPE